MEGISERDRIALIAKAEEWRLDPVKFAYDIWGGWTDADGKKFELTPQQTAVMRDFGAEGSLVAIKSGVSTGKTAIAAMLVIWFLILHRPCKMVATSASSQQLSDALMPEISLWISRGPLWMQKLVVVQSMSAYIKGAQQIQFLTAKTARADKPDALQGLHSDNIAVIIDEAFAVSDKVIEVAWGALTKKNARLLMMGNPTHTSGYAYRAFNKDRDMYKCHTFSTLESPLVSPEALEKLKRTYNYPDSPEAKARLLGEFPAGSFNQLITTDIVKAAQERWGIMPSSSYEYAPVVFGVDTAWMGGDRSTIYMRQGNYSRLLFSHSKIDVNMMTSKIVEFADKYKPQTIFIDTGGPAGGGVYDNLKNTGYPLIKVNFGGSPNSEQYQYKRDEIWFEMRDWLVEGGAIECNEEIADDLTAPLYNIGRNGKRYIESKDQMRARGNRSPDIADGLACTFAQKVFSTDTINAVSVGGGGLGRSDSRWNPFA